MMAKAAAGIGKETIMSEYTISRITEKRIDDTAGMRQLIALTSISMVDLTFLRRFYGIINRSGKGSHTAFVLFGYRE